MKKSKPMSAEFGAIHGFIIAEAVAHALNDGHFKALDNRANGRVSIFAHESLACQVLDILESAGIINKSTTEAR